MPDYDDEDRLRLVRREIGRLDLVDQTILMRTLVEGAKPGVIAQDLGVSSEVVRTRKSRAVRKLVERVTALSRSAAHLHSVDG
jgi:DNA-directed RNA polymerase specialized sigma24 family protein